jgi:uncharacterized Zn-binding protein involved in type VI secretion
MGNPALVAGDTITGTCTIHQIPSASGTAPAGPLPFAAKLTDGLAQKVFIGGKPAAVFASSGYNAPPHPGIVDPPYATPTNQLGSITTGSATVLIEGQAAATTASGTMCCAAPGTAVGPGVPTVLIG